MNDNWDLQEALVAAVYHQQWIDGKNLDEYMVGRGEGEGEKIYLGRCLLNERRA